MTTTGVFTNASRLTELSMAFAGADKISVGFDPTGRVESLDPSATPEQTMGSPELGGMNFC